MQSFKKCVLESKDHLIDKNSLLNTKEKEILKNYFQKYPQKEKLIDWNKKYLPFEAFTDVLNLVSMRDLKKRVDRAGLEGFRENFDIITCKSLSDNFTTIIPLNHPAVKLLSSSRFSKSDGDWCVASGNPEGFIDYSFHQVESQIFIILLFLGTKYIITVVLDRENPYKYSIGNFHDVDQNNLHNSDSKTFLNKLLSLNKEEIKNAIDKIFKFTPLILAIKKKNLSLVKSLVNSTNINKPINKSTKTPICYAIESGDVEMIKFLISRGANLNELITNFDLAKYTVKDYYLGKNPNWSDLDLEENVIKFLEEN